MQQEPPISKNIKRENALLLKKIIQFKFLSSKTVYNFHVSCLKGALSNILKAVLLRVCPWGNS